MLKRGANGWKGESNLNFSAHTELVQVGGTPPPSKGVLGVTTSSNKGREGKTPRGPG